MIPGFAMVADQNHGAILAWPDGRNIPCSSPSECDVYAQRISDTRGPAPAADLAISASVSPDPVPINSNQTYEVHIKNNGPDVAHGVTLSVETLH